MKTDIGQFIKEKESEFQSEEIRLGDNWSWNFRDHIQMIFHLKNSVFFKGENDWLRPFKAVMLPIIELANWTEDIEVKDIVFYIDGKDDRAKSFLIKKYHDEIYVKEHDVDKFIDDITESDNSYGGALVQDTADGCPEVMKMVNIAFCDQTDILGGALGVKYHFSPDKLRAMSTKGWGKEENGATISLDELATLANESKQNAGKVGTKEDKVTSKTIEVYVVKGSLPEHYLEDNDNMEDWYNQVQIVAFYVDAKNKRQHQVLYRKKENKSTLRFASANPEVENRALHRGVGESMLHPQIWTNWLSIHRHNFYEAASKVPLVTDDPAYANRNEVQDMENLEVTNIAQGSILQRIETASPANVAMMTNAVNEWFEQAQLEGAAQDPILGKEQVSGTTFRGQERTVAQGKGSHDRKRGKRAKFIEQIYRDIIIPDIVSEIMDGKKFIATLTSEELAWVRKQVVNKQVNEKYKERIKDFSKPLPTEEEKEMLKEKLRNDFESKGNKQLMEILKKEFDGVSVQMGINIANKQKDLAGLSDKLLSVFQYVFANPQAFQQAMQIPALAKSFQDILEFSGLNQADFLSLTDAPQLQQSEPNQTINQVAAQPVNQPIGA